MPKLPAWMSSQNTEREVDYFVGRVMIVGPDPSDRQTKFWSFVTDGGCAQGALTECKGKQFVWNTEGVMALIEEVEATINPTSLIGGFWVFVYGLMVYLPACTVPRDRAALPVRRWHYLLAVSLPFLGVIPGSLVATILRHLLNVQFLPGVQ